MAQCPIEYFYSILHYVASCGGASSSDFDILSSVHSTCAGRDVSSAPRSVLKTELHTSSDSLRAIIYVEPGYIFWDGYNKHTKHSSRSLESNFAALKNIDIAVDRHGSNLPPA